jgi:F-type H+-transporting ATPase subunit delta
VAYRSRCAVSGGFAVVQPKSALSINAVEGYPLEDFSAEAVRAQIAEAQKVVNGGGSEQDIAEAKIELEVSFESRCCPPTAANSGQVLESLQAHLK